MFVKISKRLQNIYLKVTLGTEKKGTITRRYLNDHACVLAAENYCVYPQILGIF